MAERQEAPRKGFWKRWGVFFLAVAISGSLVSACTAPKTLSGGTDFNSDSETAVVVLGTSVAGHSDTTNERRGLEGLVFSMHWQRYDPEKLRLVPGNGELFTYRTDSVFEGDEFRQWEVTAIEIPPGSYALTAVQIHHTITAFVAIKTSKFDLHGSHRSLGIETALPVAPAKNFLFEVRPGQVVYLGHFEFVSAPHNSDLVVDINYSHDEAAARAALEDYPDVKGGMITLDLKAPTEQAAR